MRSRRHTAVLVAEQKNGGFAPTPRIRRGPSRNLLSGRKKSKRAASAPRSVLPAHLRPSDTCDRSHLRRRRRLVLRPPPPPPPGSQTSEAAPRIFRRLSASV